MITLEDCVALSGLSEEEILAIAEHEHIPVGAATGMARYLSRVAGGVEVVCTMIIDDVRVAQASGNREHIRELLHILHHYLKAHPEARPSVHPWSSAG